MSMLDNALDVLVRYVSEHEAASNAYFFSAAEKLSREEYDSLREKWEETTRKVASAGVLVAQYRTERHPASV